MLGPPASVAELNQAARHCVAKRINSRVHRTTKVAPSTRLEAERRFLAPCPGCTSTPPTVEPRRVHVALSPRPVGWRALLGASRGPRPVVGARVEVDATDVELSGVGEPSPATVWHRPAPTTCGTQRIGQRPKPLPWESRPALRLVPPAPAPSVPLPLPLCDYDVEVPDLAERYALEHQKP